VTELLDLLKSTTSQRILMKSPPASGKTALLQGVVRGLLSEGKEVIIVQGVLHGEDDRAVLSDKLLQAIDNAPAQSVLIIDDAQQLYQHAKLWAGLVKTQRSVHLLGASSYGASKVFPDTPAVFERVIGFWGCSFNATEAWSLAGAIFKGSTVPSDQQPAATKLFAQQSRVLSVPASHQAQPMELSSEDEDDEKGEDDGEQNTAGDGDNDRFHVGLLRRLLEGFVAHFRKPGNPPSAWSFLFSSDVLKQDTIKERCFGAYQMQFELEAKRCLSNLLVRSRPVALEELADDAMNKIDHDEAIKMLLRTCVVVETEGKVDFSTPMAQRVYFQKVYPSRGSDKMVHSSINDFIVDTVSMFEPVGLQHGCKSSQRGIFPSEAVFQHQFSAAACQLVPPSVLLCPELAAYVKSGRVDFLIGEWAVELLKLGDNIKGHRDRFLGKYNCPEIKEYRVVDFKMAGQKPSFAAVKDLPEVHMAFVFSEDFTQATVYQGQEGKDEWDSFSIKLGQDFNSIVARRGSASK
jgi:hypothetical protein